MKVSIVVPTLNAAYNWERFAGAIANSVPRVPVLIVDSGSTDGTDDLARVAGFRFHQIARTEFNHGGTRQLAIELLSNDEVIVFLTQDAVLANPSAISELLKYFEDPDVAAVFGRQLPRPEATPIEAHARIFNYPPKSDIRTLVSRERLGLKAIFISNSFAAYRRNALIAVGGFPRKVIFGEDTITAAKLLLAGWKVGYVAESSVYHSHRYTWTQDFKRYFDIGVLHTNESWLLREFGGTGGEGRRFVMSELNYLWPRYWWLIPSALVRTALKLLGYQLGKNESRLSVLWKRRLSMHRRFWS